VWRSTRAKPGESDGCPEKLAALVEHALTSRLAAGDWAMPQKAATALDRYGHVDEVAALVAFVAGPESSYITGANLTVDGGMNA
jgi:NAD(P)-dependent dehydrogenase (short-subunit alcohol dehydrogenase family)